VTIAVDAAAGRHPIDPNIYGTAWGDTASLSDLNFVVNRAGGNTTTTYNWQQNASNHASDYYFESIGDSGGATPGALVDDFIASSRSGGAQASITIPTLGWVAKLGPNRDKLASFSVAKYGAQQSTDYWFPDAGNGVLPNGQPVTGNDPNDANVPADVAFERGWVQHLIAQWGTASNGGQRFYTLDNEPSIWHATHRDVHPTGATMEEVRDKFLAMAGMIKSLDPGAQIVGPEEWGWSGYLFSGYDQQYGSQHGWTYLPDRAAHNNMDYLPWLLDQIHQHDVAAGQRLLDYFTVHYYPQGGEFSDDVSTTMQLLRNRSTRSLWDPNYTDQSWINDKVHLISRLKDWVNQYYPGTKAGITEYNWGAEGHMNGATTQADILGIFGREGLDLANRWTTPAAGSPAYLAMKMYRNYDGSHSTFGETSVSASVVDPDQVDAFASVRASDGALTVMVINKNLYDPAHPTATTPITINVGNFLSDGVAHPWQLAAINPADQTHAAITHLADVTGAGNSFTFSAPQQSITLFVLRPGQVSVPGAPANVTAAGNEGQVALRWDPSAGATSYKIYRGTASGGEGATPYRTGVTGTSFVDTAVSGLTTYFYQLTAVNSAGESARSTEVSARQQAVLPGLAIDSGGGASGSFLSDRYFAGGSTSSTTHAIDTSGVANAAPAAVYQTWRFGSSFIYTVPGLIAGGAYTVRLHFAEDTATRVGQRTFNAGINGVQVLTRFDVYAAAGGDYKAVVREFAATASSAGKLVIGFAATAGPARVNGIEILRRPLLAVDAGGAAVGAYRADAFFQGGTASQTTAVIDTSLVTNAAPLAVYQSERYGDFRYTLTGLTPGRVYVVRLDFAELYWDTPGSRRFNVRINGSPVLTNFDVYAVAGAKDRAVRRQFAATADATGRITIDFASLVNYATVSGIALL
jgi:hypothetical protein